MVARLQCCVPFCKRSRGDWKNDPVSDHSEFVCAVHWKLVPLRWRRLLRKAYRHHDAVGTEQSWRIGDWLWKRCKAMAISKAMTGG